MDTFLLLFGVISLFFLFGLGPTLLLLPAKDNYRVLLMPAIGLCSGTLFTNLLASLELEGRTIGLISLPVFVILAVTAIYRAPLSRLELRSVGLPLAICSFALLFQGWPLLVAGFRSYLGFGNPDVPFYIGIFEYLMGHPFGLPTSDFYSGGYQSADPSAILGLSYFFSLVSQLTGQPVGPLFSVFCGAQLFLIPASIFLFTRIVLEGNQTSAICASALSICSSLTLLTFCLQSLGALTVLATLPVGLSLAALYFREPTPGNGIGAAILFSGMFYLYFPGFGVLAVLASATVLGRAALRKPFLKSSAILATGILLLTASVFFSHACSVARRLLHESMSARLTAQQGDEILMSYALTLTEEFIPFFWGLKVPTLEIPFFFRTRGPEFLLLFLVGCLLFGMTIFLFLRRSCFQLRADQWAAYGAVALLFFSYGFQGNGYGVFKLVAWVHPLISALLGVAVSSTLADRIRLNSKPARLYLIPTCILAYAFFNLCLGYRVGSYSLGKHRGGGMHNLPALSLDDFGKIRESKTLAQAGKVIVALPDSVVQRWLVTFWPSTDSPVLVPDARALLIADSQTRPPLSVMGRDILHWRDSSYDLISFADSSLIQESPRFVRSFWEDTHSLLYPGKGWYRPESVAESTLSWQRRFRWIRKRAELLLLNPGTRRRKLSLALTAGYGYPSDRRHLRVFVNGHQFDSIEFTGYARTTTRPFTPTHPWTQLEIEVEETVRPIERQGGLWNRWVPRDPRQLNVAISEIGLLDAEQPLPSVPASLALTDTMDFAKAWINGFYPDLWIGETATVHLNVPSHPRRIELNGMMPSVSIYRFPYSIEVLVNGSLVGRVVVSTPGDFKVGLELPELESEDLRSGKTVQVSLRPESTFIPAQLGISSDARQLSLRVYGIRITQD
ncbi:MAG: hypothetical protein AB1898_06255 [Acidobacteriota bacterium]